MYASKGRAMLLETSGLASSTLNMRAGLCCPFPDGQFFRNIYRALKCHKYFKCNANGLKKTGYASMFFSLIGSDGSHSSFIQLEIMASFNL